MNFFNKLDCCIPQEKYYNKLIRLGIGGHWEADAVNMILHQIREKVLANPKSSTDILSKYKDDEIESFFYFFFYGPHLRWNTIPEELKIIEKYNPNIFKLMKNGLKKAIEDQKHFH